MSRVPYDLEETEEKVTAVEASIADSRHSLQVIADEITGTQQSMLSARDSGDPQAAQRYADRIIYLHAKAAAWPDIIKDQEAMLEGLTALAKALRRRMADVEAQRALL